MLIRYKKNMEKIAMGLLSFMPEEKKEIKKLQMTIQEYNENPDWHLYLWKEEEGVVGLVGARVEDEINLIIQHISVNPSHRNQGLGQKMIQEMKRLNNNKYAIIASEDVQEFYHKAIDKQIDVEE